MFAPTNLNQWATVMFSLLSLVCIVINMLTFRFAWPKPRHIIQRMRPFVINIQFWIGASHLTGLVYILSLQFDNVLLRALISCLMIAVYYGIACSFFVMWFRRQQLMVTAIPGQHGKLSDNQRIVLIITVYAIVFGVPMSLLLLHAVGVIMNIYGIVVPVGCIGIFYIGIAGYLGKTTYLTNQELRGRHLAFYFDHRHTVGRQVTESSVMAIALAVPFILEVFQLIITWCGVTNIDGGFEIAQFASTYLIAFHNIVILTRTPDCSRESLTTKIYLLPNCRRGTAVFSMTQLEQQYNHV